MPTVATGAIDGMTVIDATPVFASAVALMVAVPGATAVTVPALTAAIAPSLVVQVSGRSVTTAPFTSFTVGVIAAVSPTVIGLVGAVRLTEPTGAGPTFRLIL